MKKKIIIIIITIILVVVLLIVGIKLSTNKKEVVADSNNIKLTESTIITKAGTYTISGTLSNGSLTVNTSGNVKIILDNVNITNKSGSAINIKKAKNVEIVLKEETTNTLSDTDKNKNESVIYSVCDLTISGEGTLDVTASKDGIFTKDDLEIVAGNITINSGDDGLKGRDSVTINNGNITINSTGDAIKTTNDENTKKGDITINGGDLTITSEKDGIQSIKDIVINDGDITITTGNGGSTKSTKEDFGREQETVNDKDSIKGIKAKGNITINKGNITIKSEDDSLHANGNINVLDGNIKLVSGDDGVRADEIIEINGGNLNIDASEGLEATYIKINDGLVEIEATDDGVNATNKSDKYTPTVEINGGDLTINMAQGDTDGLDSNGNLYINGGNINITCNSPFDCDGEAKYNGGTMTINGTVTTEITNQMMGGSGKMQGMNGEMPQR